MTMKERLRIMREIITRNRRRDAAYARSQEKPRKGEKKSNEPRPVR